MDPFSLTTGIVALLGTCNAARRTFAKLRRLKDAPVVIQALNNEVSDLCLIMLDLSEHLEGMRAEEVTTAEVNAAVIELFSTSLDHAKSMVHDIKELLEGRIYKTGGKEELKLNRTNFFREYSNLLRYQEALREARLEIAALFSELGLRKISQVEVLLSSIRSEELPSIIQSQFKIEERLDRIEDLQLSMSNSLHVSSSNARLPRTSTIDGPERLSIPLPSLSASESSSLVIPVSRLQTNARLARCNCRCQTNASTSLHSVFGTLFLGYAAILREGVCQSGCPYHTKLEATIVFVFPLWFVRQALSFQIGFQGQGSIKCSLKVEQVIPVDHPVYDMIDLGDIAGIKRLLISRQVSINAQSPHGPTLLHHSTIIGNIASTEFLIEFGADTCTSNFALQSPEKAAWDQILVQRKESAWSQKFASLFPKPNFDELYNFTPLHLAVLGLTNASLDGVLRDTKIRPDEVDQTGRTALIWAARRGDYEAVETLLARGADCNKTDNLGNAPLSYAVRKCSRCTELLLEANANARIKDAFDATLLHRAIPFHTDESKALRVTKLLVEAGVDVNATRASGETALFFTSETHHREVAEYLLEHGANPTICSASGSNALCHAIQRKSHPLIELLLEKGEDHVRPLEMHGTLMHLVAEFTDTAGLRLLTGRLKRRDITVRNKDGLSPYQIGMQRIGVGTEWQNAFWNFLKSIDKDMPPMETSEPSIFECPREQAEARSETRSARADGEDIESEDKFEDAVEHQVESR